MGVRRHLDALTAEGLVTGARREQHRVGRPPAGWRLTSAGLELFPRRYDMLALELIEDVAAAGPDAVDELFARRTTRLAAEYEKELDGARGLDERLEGIARIRDDEGYEASCTRAEKGTFVLTEANCAVHHVAERCPAVCAHEHDLLQVLLGPGVEVTRTSHILNGDPTCSYRVRVAARTPAAPA